MFQDSNDKVGDVWQLVDMSAGHLVTVCDVCVHVSELFTGLIWNWQVVGRHFRVSRA